MDQKKKQNEISGDDIVKHYTSAEISGYTIRFTDFKDFMSNYLNPHSIGANIERRLAEKMVGEKKPILEYLVYVPFMAFGLIMMAYAFSYAQEHNTANDLARQCLQTLPKKTLPTEGI